MKIDLKDDFLVEEEGTTYYLPTYKVVEGKGIERLEAGQTQVIKFVRGSKLGEEDVEKRTGTLHEHLLAMMIHDLQFKNSLVPSRESSIVITKLQEAMMWLRERQIERNRREVEGTYKK